MLLQDAMRLSGAAYTVGGGRRAATRGRPYRKRIFFWGATPLGEFHKGGRGPLLVVSRGEDFKGEGEIRNPPLL